MNTPASSIVTERHGTITPLVIDQPLQDTGLLVLTELWGEFETKTRQVWIRPCAISHFAEFIHWRPEGTARPRGSIVYMLNGQTLKTMETPEAIAACLR